MARIDLKFLDADNDTDWLSTEVINTYTFDLGKVISIYGRYEDEDFVLWLDKSTAIKFAKTLRTEINKIES